MNLKITTKDKSFKSDNGADIKAGVNKLLAASPGEAIDINALGVHTETDINPKGYAEERYRVISNYDAALQSRATDVHNGDELCEVIDELHTTRQLPIKILEYETDEDANDPIAEILIYK